MEKFINAKNYETETKWKQIISIASTLFIFISSIGLLGLVILSIEQSTKEIGMRKVLGVAVSRIIVLISKGFLILISLAFVVAVPVGYYFVNKWLQDFAYPHQYQLVDVCIGRRIGYCSCTAHDEFPQ